MKQMMLLLLLVLGLVSVACQQDAAAQEPVDDVMAVAAMPQEVVAVTEEVVQVVDVVAIRTKALKAAMPKVEVAVKEVEETAVTVVEEAAALPVQDDHIVTHEVMEGEWIYEIARCYGTSPQAIIDLNFPYHYHGGYWHHGYWYYGYGHMHNANHIYPGQELMIPDVGSVSEPYGPPCVRKVAGGNQHEPSEPGTYIHEVEQGDWIYEIARCYGTDAKHIMRANALYNPDYIKPGMLLVIPLAGSVDDEFNGPDCIDYVTVEDDDTWETLADRYGTTVEILKRANPGPLSSHDRIWAPVHND